MIDTRINNRTNTTNLQLRNAAEQAARKTKFNAIGGENNQTGTITYYWATGVRHITLVPGGL